jgi:hypothetical protein
MRTSSKLIIPATIIVRTDGLASENWRSVASPRDTGR